MKTVKTENLKHWHASNNLNDEAISLFTPSIPGWQPYRSLTTEFALKVLLYQLYRRARIAIIPKNIGIL